MSTILVFGLMWCLFIHITRAQISTNDCKANGKVYRPGSITKVYCQECICIEDILVDDHYVWECNGVDCLIRESIIDHVNGGNNGWKADSYSFLQDKTLTSGMEHRLGTFLPESDGIPMRPSQVREEETFPRGYDLREKSKEYISAIRNQGDCASSWAFSTTAVTSDRIALKTSGKINVDLSPQQLISCIGDKQPGCAGGHIERAWEHMRFHGVVDEECYPYTSGMGSSGKCPTGQTSSASKNDICPKRKRSPGSIVSHKILQSYRIPSDEREIMKEIITNGPVQATFAVHEDFFMYKSGIYKHSFAPDDIGLSGYHSVRIVGWGSECSSQGETKYWIVANSWGKQWGESGYFRIQKGVNECEIESYVVGVKVRPTFVKMQLELKEIWDLTLTSLGNIVATGWGNTMIYNSRFQQIKYIYKKFLCVAKTKDDQLAFTTYSRSKTIHLYSEVGSSIRTITCGAPVSRLEGIASLSVGELVVTDYDTKGVFLVDSIKGNTTQISPSGMFDYMYPWYVTVDINSYIIVSDWNGDFIKVINRDGQEILHYGETGSGEGYIYGPTDVCTDRNGFIIVGDRHNKRWTAVHCQIQRLSLESLSELPTMTINWTLPTLNKNNNNNKNNSSDNNKYNNTMMYITLKSQQQQ
ncbi:unnamed protein product [Owenia fusiformis]|uniref:Peptidase C1A papain C-terminal domain-containing protein n=1 Tax=Owenia fusiformis TaxID=6347 RepID=A0A8S4NNQ7_OWEFU|nr:unnamed protein product [Owenia fusiformis]